MQKFWLDLAVITGDKPLLKLRVRAFEVHQEEMAQEFCAVLKEALPAAVVPIVGTFDPGV